MKFFKLFLISLILLPTALFAVPQVDAGVNSVVPATVTNTSTTHNGKPKEVKVGIYIKNLHDFNFLKETFAANFWLWFTYADPNLQLIRFTEIVNDVQTRISDKEPVALNNGFYWVSAEYNTVVKKHWELKNFPFDTQSLEIYFESNNKDMKQLVYVPDLKNSAIDDDARQHNWKIVSFNLKSIPHKYKTAFGYSADHHPYSRFVVEIKIKRVGWRRFFHYFGVLYLAMFLTFSVLLLPATPGIVNSRVGLIAASIFATFGNKILIDSNLALSNRLILVDAVQMVAMIYMALVLCVVLLETYLFRRGSFKIVKRINVLAIIASLTVLPAYNYLLVYRAIH